MSGERLAELAVKSMVDYLDTNLATYLRAVETAQGMSSGALTDPVDVIGADLPDCGGETPIVEVWENVGKEITHADKFYAYDLTIAVTHAYDADIEAGRRFVRNYMTALLDCLAASPTLSDKVGHVIPKEQGFAVQRGSNAKHLHHAVLGVEVHIYDS